jgi:hypothetical protein
METQAIIEQGHSRLGAVLRTNRLRIALAVVVVEGLLVLFGAVPWWIVLVLAAATVGLYFAVGRESDHQAIREASWIAAVSQVAVVLVPAITLVVTTLAVVAVVVAAVVALVLLFRERR